MPHLFYFSGDSAETTDNLSQISGSADADQMSILFLLRKQPHKSMKCRKYSGKNARGALCYLQEDEALPRAGSYVRVFGEVSPFCRQRILENSTQQPIIGEKDCLFALRKTKLPLRRKPMDGWKNFFHSCAMNRRYCSGSWGGKRTVRPHPPWCSDGKKEWTAK